MRRLLALFRRAGSAVGGFVDRRSRLQLGVIWLAVTVVAGGLLMAKSSILLALRPGETLAAEFSSRYKLRDTISKVEVAGVRVGTVTGLEERPGGGALVTMKLDPGTRDTLGTTPEAAIRPSTFLGGPGLSAYIELTPGGSPGRFASTRIPAEHTTVPVEFDRLNEVLDDDARKGLTATVRGLDQVFGAGGREALRDVLADAPPALRPAGPGLEALSGEQPGDLARMVDDLGKAAAALTATDGELEAVVDDLATFAGTLGDRAPDAERAVADMPATLAAARSALTALDGTLSRLQATAPQARPSVQRLGELLRRMEPVLSKARPLLADLRPLAADLGPALDDLGPASALARRFLTDLDEPVIGRIGDRIVPTVLSPYAESDRDTVLYEELGYMLAGLAGVTQYIDPAGSFLNFHVGVGTDTASVPGVTGVAPRPSVPRGRML